MVQFLSSEFFDEATQVLVEHAGFMDAAHGVTLAVQFVVTDSPHGDVAYGLRIERGVPSVVEGSMDTADLTITNDYPTAAGISSGEMNTQTAFISGRLRLDGDMAALMRNQTLIQQFSSAMSALELEY